MHQQWQVLPAGENAKPQQRCFDSAEPQGRKATERGTSSRQTGAQKRSMVRMAGGPVSEREILEPGIRRPPPGRGALSKPKGAP